MTTEAGADGAEAAEGVRLLFEHDYYDGPVSGLAEWRGEQWWYDLDGDGVDAYTVRPRRYVLRRLTAEEIAAEWAAHREFEAWIGAECCQDHDDRPPRRPRLPEPEERALRERYHSTHPFPEEPYRDRPVVARFTR